MVLPSVLLQPRGIISPSRFQEAGTSLERARGHWCRGLLSLLCTPIPPNGMAAVTRPHSGPLAPFLFTAILVFFWLDLFVCLFVFVC